MLDSLHLKNVGPASEMTMDLAPRLNLITGDNGLGKTLLLDCAWWALTRTWPLTWGGKGVVPDKQGASIEWRERRGRQTVLIHSKYEFNAATWKTGEVIGSPKPSLVLYARVDGGISVHDPLRNFEHFRIPGREQAWSQRSTFQFRDADIWDGLDVTDATGGASTRACEGLIRDVVRWAVEAGSTEFNNLATVVKHLTADEPFKLTRNVRRVFIDDARDYPILEGPAGELPVVHAPAGLRRILGLAYLVVWAWREHRVAASLKKQQPTDSMVLLIDEVESHLHPKWQRKILRGLLDALGTDVRLQVIATTHSPLVLASAEPFFDADQDAWFDLDLEQRNVVLRKRPYVRHGEVGNWLTSDAFDLREPRSVDGENAVLNARALMGRKDASTAEIAAADEKLRAAGLPDIDTFWVRWGYFVDSQEKPSRVAAPLRSTTSRRKKSKR